ncbi:MAG: DegT/DnrJ/EryC1/StrS family aminotransferase [Polyangiaceae bacterium]
MAPATSPKAADAAVFGASPVLRKSDHALWPLLGDEEARAVRRVLDRGILSGNYAPESSAFEEEFAAFAGAKHALLTHSGTSALEVALHGAGIGPGDEVLVPAYSFVATPLAVMHVGATPVFVDVDVRTGFMDLALAEKAVTSRTRGMMPVHIHGAALDMAAFTAFAAKHRLTLVEDAAQAHGAKFDGRPVGAIGTSGGFSMQSSKNLSTGEGGVFVTNDAAVAERANQFRNFGQDVARDDAKHYDTKHPLDGHRALVSSSAGSMYRGNELMAAVARVQLAKLPARTEACQANALWLSQRLAALPGVVVPPNGGAGTSVFHKFRVAFDHAAAGLDVAAAPASRRAFRDAMLRALAAEGCEVVLWQNEPLPAQPVFRARTAQPIDRDLPGGTALSENYDPARYPRTSELLDGSIVLFSQSCPLIAQDRATVERYAEAFERVWNCREAVSRLPSAG